MKARLFFWISLCCQQIRKKHMMVCFLQILLYSEDLWKK